MSGARDRGQALLQAGVALFLAGLLVGLAVPAMANPRMGLASHLEGLMNGLFLIVLGLLWPRLVLSPLLERVTFWTALYGTIANLAATLLAAIWGAGRMMPIAAQGHVGTEVQERAIDALLVSLALAMVTVCVLVLAGLRRPRRSRPGIDVY
ncbi:MAG: hydrogenase [Vicinamibacterales bacterium]